MTTRASKQLTSADVNLEPLCHWYPNGEPHTALCGNRREQLIADEAGPRCLVCEDMRPKAWF